MSPVNLTSPAVLRDRTVHQLQQFYQKPIAKVSTELLATLTAVIVLAFFAIRPTLLTMSQLLKDIEDRKTTSEALSRKIAALSTLSTEFPGFRNEIALLNIVIPDTPDFDGFARRLEKIAADNNLIISSLQVSQIPPEAAFNPNAPAELTSFTVAVNFKGDYTKVRSAIQNLLNMDRYVTLESVVLNAKRDEIEKTNILLTTVNLRVWYYGTPPPAKREGR